MRELLSNNSLFVGQLYEDKSLELRTRDLIFFTTDLPDSELLLNNSLLELIYFLSKFQSTPIIRTIPHCYDRQKNSKYCAAK